jgi:hypothetical protein
MPPPDTSGAQLSPAVAWFGSALDGLHPALQALHRQGGAIQGQVAIAFGSGLGGMLGRRIAARLGIPTDRSRCGLRVVIGHSATAMHWVRSFEGGGVSESRFAPRGRYPDGEWIEHTGPVRMRLGVVIVEGDWRWRLHGLSVYGVPVPARLLRLDASKCIEAGAYRFAVRVALTGIGPLLGYEGLLHRVPAKVS